MPDPLVLAAFAVVLGLVVLVAILAGGFDSETEKRLERRLHRVGAAVGQAPSAEAAMELRRGTRDSGIAGLDRLIKRFLPRPEELRRRLGRTGYRISTAEYLLASIFVGLVVGFALSRLLGLSPALSVLAGIGAGFALPHAVVGSLISRRLKAFTAQFPESIDLIVRGLKSGLPVPASMQTVSEEMQDPIAVEFRQVTDQLRIGQTLDDALRDAADRLPTAEFRFFVISLAVQRETGGNLADILRKRRQMKLKIKAMSSEAKASAMILGSLPFLLFAVLFVINPGYVTTLFQDPRGMLMLGAGLGSLGVGILVMARMVRFEI